MVSSEDIEELKAKRICFQCVGEAYLSDQMERDGAVAQCAYCQETEKTFSVGALADRIESAFEDYYILTPDEPDTWEEALMSDMESGYEWERGGEPVVDAIENAAGVPHRAAEDIQAILDDRHNDFDLASGWEDTEFSSKTYYAKRGTRMFAWEETWCAFEHSLKTEARFFSRNATVHLASVFGNIDKLKTRKGRSLIVQAGPKRVLSHLYRARVFQSKDKLQEALCRPDQHLGSPPTRLASSGRMNARGISVFYGATASRVAIAEVRPPVGSAVAVAKFDITRPLRLLDLTALENTWDDGSIFDPTLKDRLERVEFLQSLGDRMTQPVMPDNEAFDYLPTQAIADFLATQNEPQLDGIVFRSVQVKGGRNVVLFHKAARVEVIWFPEGTVIEADSILYHVNEYAPPPSNRSPANDHDDWLGGQPFLGPSYHSRDYDFRDVALRVDPASVTVNEVDWGSYRCTAYKVSRHRHEKPKPKF
ncbi:MAG: RES family NAD+ phosphorylase [Aquabacterium sp.]|uniref:RES family NAD+ phosphorylase n=1 Tax=Aquabacterium sp. TaxID=1872578 RepID=UPI0027189A80|nr:RES family NAD+ phosphorylase [Aquabacterium sp.]MDO9002391.1 RES family NAD+ phosphorylase [Aquabacterium sp.]